MVGIPVGTTYTARVRGRAVKTVTCEKCSDAYVYVVERTAQGSGMSPLFLDNDGARNRASVSAKHALSNALDRAVDPAACPACGWYQETMVREARRRRGRWLKVPAIVAGVFGGFTLVLIGLLDSKDFFAFHYTQGNAPIWTVVAVSFGIAIVLLAIRHLCCTVWTPNADTMWKRRAKAKEEGRVMRKADFDRLGEGHKGP
jgi:hypothetical protein